MSVARLNRVACRLGRELELERRLAAVITATRQGPDCEAYRWFHSDLQGETTTYLNLSRWRTSEGWERHLTSDGLKASMDQEAADLCLLGPPEHHNLTEVGNA